MYLGLKSGSWISQQNVTALRRGAQGTPIPHERLKHRRQVRWGKQCRQCLKLFLWYKINAMRTVKMKAVLKLQTEVTREIAFSAIKRLTGHGNSRLFQLSQLTRCFGL